jgi:15-hydroxyprostaglandin dehydrogenase (NAD)
VFNNAGRLEPDDVYENPGKSTKRKNQYFSINFLLDSITNFINIMITSVYQGCIIANNHFQDQLKQDPSKQFCIINTSSAAGFELMENGPIYSLCKKAVNYRLYMLYMLY